ncbi:MAG: nitroreductase family protein [Candidatus Micrarchaeota archaeon]
MELDEALKGRRSVRAFAKKDVPEGMVRALLEAAVLAPSAGNLQSRKFFVVRKQEIRDALAVAAHGQDFISEAPIALVVCADSLIQRRYGERGVLLYSILDCAAAIENLMLKAHSLGLGTCWVGAFEEAEVSHILNLPAHLRPISIIPIGFPNERPRAPPRVRIEDAAKFI